MKLVLTAPAKADLFSATEFYNDHEPELGARFLSAVDAKVEQILAFPETPRWPTGPSAKPRSEASPTPFSMKSTRSSSWSWP